jgi:cytoskeleton protein RodZ
MNVEILGLKTWRERKGVTLGAIAASTKLRVSLLEAIECGNFSKLPGGIYTTNYLRQYARAIEFDEFELLAFYKASLPAAAVDEPSQPQSSPRGSRLLFQP